MTTPFGRSRVATRAHGGSQIRDAVERAEIRAHRIERGGLKTVDFVYAKLLHDHPISEAGLVDAPLRLLHHRRRPVDGDDAMAAPSEVLRVRSRAAAEVEDARSRRHEPFDRLPDARPHRRQNAVLGVRSVVVLRDAVERPLRIEERGYDVHGVRLQPAFNEQTQRPQVGFDSTSSVDRKVRRLRVTRSASGVWRMLPTAG
jgi:hypothetical protein